MDVDVHRGWNGGWKCRATVRGNPPLEFALQRTLDDALLALPVPFPRGWRARGVGDSLGRARTCDDLSAPRRIVPNPPAPVDSIDHRSAE
ncbi:hypothetical protein [Gemmatimonas sp.]|uniref:hypothetical protein n=1 Tax=Gemmatimonas sp. TaxID=1962908 RepID=UPI0037BFC777